MSMIHVYMDKPDEFEVWLDVDDGAPRDGVCIGAGATEVEAYRDAIATLATARKELDHAFQSANPFQLMAP